MIRQLRPFYTPEELAEVYAEPYDSSRWPDHVLRVQHTAAILKSMEPESVADLSCGDGRIVRGAELDCPTYLGDYRGDWDYNGPIEQMIEQIPYVDVFVLSETLEHVERPGELLESIYRKADRLLLSTPHGEWHDQNPQHYWGWDTAGVSELLTWAGWEAKNSEVELYDPPCGFHYYTFQIWRCKT